VHIYADMQKAERHSLILDLISGRIIRRQDELAQELRAKGLEVTQASIREISMSWAS
jgi:arginine repressor